MDSLTELIYHEIKRKYKSVRKFSIDVGIAQTTIVSALKNGIGGTSYNTVMKICRALDIQIVNYSTPYIIDSKRDKLLNIYNSLDENSQHTVDIVMQIEYNRCMNDENEESSVYEQLE